MAVKYKLEFGEGVKIIVASNSDGVAGKLVFQGQLTDLDSVKKYFSAWGIDMKEETPMKVADCLKSWDFKWSVEGKPSAPPAEEDPEPAKPSMWGKPNVG